MKIYDVDTIAGYQKIIVFDKRINDTQKVLENLKDRFPSMKFVMINGDEVDENSDMLEICKEAVEKLERQRLQQDVQKMQKIQRLRSKLERVFGVYFFKRIETEMKNKKFYHSTSILKNSDGMRITIKKSWRDVRVSVDVYDSDVVERLVGIEDVFWDFFKDESFMKRSITFNFKQSLYIGRRSLHLKII
jgi:hypothetical protein